MADLKIPDLNSIMIAGNLVKDPKLSHTGRGTPVSNFTIASNRRYKDNFQEVKEDVSFFGVVAWDKLGESCAESLHKGSAVLIAGELQSREWKNEDGYFLNRVEIKARRIQFLNKQRKDLQDFESNRINTDNTNSSFSEKETTPYDFGFGKLEL
ncbi:single-stranded DNA-binding protein [bacterium]|nr:single-stranded DNA-binding protein [bacterium]